MMFGMFKRFRVGRVSPCGHRFYADGYGLPMDIRDAINWTKHQSMHPNDMKLYDKKRRVGVVGEDAIIKYLKRQLKES